MYLKHSGVDTNGIAEVKQNKIHGLEFVWHTCLGNVVVMCGNGCRIFAAFAKISGIHAKDDDVTFLAGDGQVHHGNYDLETREGWASLTDVSVSEILRISDNEFISTSEYLPHMVVFVDYDVRRIDDANKYGREMSKMWNKYTPNAAFLLVNFVNEENGVLYARCCTLTLGKEPRSMSCGTGTAVIGIVLNFFSFVSHNCIGVGMLMNLLLLSIKCLG